VQVGDLVQCVESFSLVRRVGMIIRIVPPKGPGPLTMDSYEILTEDGKTGIYSSIAVRCLHENW
jgi:hypothetical protein